MSCQFKHGEEKERGFCTKRQRFVTDCENKCRLFLAKSGDLTCY